MTYAGRRFILALALALAALTSTTVAVPAQAQGLFAQPKYAAIVVDANTGEVLYNVRADALRHPASLTKIMTLYLTFEALATGRLSLDEQITISPHAYSMMPSKVSTHPGETLTVEEAIPAMTVHSANDVAVAMAERIGGSEARFAQLMTLRAHELGMTNTSFVNASGLPPDGEQISSARDMAILSRAVMRDYPQYYHYFGLKSIVFHGKVLQNHNHLVGRMPGVDGMKTGYTSLAGFNLVASAEREGHRLITVVMGGPSTAARDENVEELLNAGFNVLDRRTHGLRMTIASLMSEPEDMAGPIERAPIEQGSGDQPDLKVVVQPQLRTMPIMAAARALEPAPVLAKPMLDVAVTDPCKPAGRHRHHRLSATGCDAGASETAALKPRQAQAKSDEKLAQAQAQPCAAHSRRRRRQACDASTMEVASAKPSAKMSGDDEPQRLASAAHGAGGGYMIQVGAYKNQGQAQDHLDKVAGDFGHMVGSASAKVERSSGNYRVRFRGLSQQEAKAACHSLSAKGQACMVMAAS